MSCITIGCISVGGSVTRVVAPLVSAFLPVTTNGQTVFTLPSDCTDPQGSILHVNGQIQRYPQDFVITGALLTFSQRHFPLTPSDEVIFFYR